MLHEVAAREVKPKLRGWQHAAVMPLSVAAGVVLVALSPTGGTRIAAAVFMLSAMLLFGSVRSTTPARGRLPPGIASSAWTTPTSSCSSPGPTRPSRCCCSTTANATILLVIVWTGASARRGLPRVLGWRTTWLYVPAYVAMGWAAVFWMPAFAESASPLS
jgi:hemolysin III